MFNMLPDLLVPEAQPDAYVWSAVLLAHAALGASLWGVLRPLAGRYTLPTVAGLYTAFEGVQAWAASTFFLADSLLDTVAILLGASLARSLWNRNPPWTAITIATTALIILAGAAVRG